MKFFASVSAVAFASLAAAEQYEYIVAGGGTAGLIVAARLAEAGKEVLLIEKGHQSAFSSGGTWVSPFNSSATYYDVPGLSSAVYSAQDPMGSPFCDDTADTAGCVLGGGSEVNDLTFARPQPADFERWPPTWRPSDMTHPEQSLYSRNPGTLFPSLDRKRYDTAAWKVTSAFLAHAGWSEVNMLTQPAQKYQTYSHPSISSVNAIRAGPVATYLPLVAGLPNFHMMLSTSVLKVERDGAQVTGVRVQKKNGQRSTIKITPKGRVIISSGAMSSPRTLWYSGIGRPNTLAAIQDGAIDIDLPGQKQWINSPVGENLRNHNQVRIRFQTNKEIEYIGSDAYTSPTQANVDLYNGQGSGVLAQTTNRGHFWTSVVLPKTGGRKRYFQGVINPANSTSVSLHLILSHGSTSIGELGIDTTTGKTTFVTPPTLNTAADKEAYRQFVAQLIGYGKAAGSPLKYEGGKEGATAAEIVSNVQPGLHYVGSCKMGTNRKTSVVDPNTQVWGTNNLHVVDASIFPDSPTSNPQAIIMVVAEQAVGKILAMDA